MTEKMDNERITSPEKLDGYLRVIRPSMWIAFIAVFAVLAAVFVWAFISQTTITVKSTGYVENNRVMCIFDKEKAKFMSVGQEMRIGGETTSISEINVIRDETAEISEEGESKDEWYYVYAKCDRPTGYYNVEVYIDGVEPISFLFG